MNIRLEDYLITNKSRLNKNFTYQSVAKHDQLDDCFIGLNNKVYNITEYKQFLKKNNRDKQLDLICGSSYRKNPIDVFKTDDFTLFEVGEFDYYYEKKITLLIFAVLTYFICIYLLLKKRTNIFIYCYFIIGFYLIIKWIRDVAIYKNPVKFRSSYIN